MNPLSPQGAIPPAQSRGSRPLFALEHTDDLIRIVCPRCGERFRFDVRICEHPHFLLHPRTDRSDCRLCTFRHPITGEAIVRVIPDDMPYSDFDRLVVKELRAVAGKAGLL
jgi:hypothetical protein